MLHLREVYVLVFFLERFVPKNGVTKFGFLLYFKKMIWVGGGAYFVPTKNLKKLFD